MIDRPRVVVLNGSCLDVVERCRGEIASRGVELIAADDLRSLTEHTIDAAVSGADVLVLPASVRSFPSAEHMARHASIKTLAIAASGYDWLDVAAATRAGIVVTNAPIPQLSEAVAEVAMGLMIDVMRQLSRHDRYIRGGDHRRGLGAGLCGKTLGIVGLGAIGQRTATRAAAFGMRVIASTPRPDEAFTAKHGIRCVSLDDLLGAADVVSLHVRLNEQTRGMIASPQLARMKQGAYLINTARRELVDEAALTAALASGALGGAGLDDPPARADSPMLKMDNVVFATHMGNRTAECMEALLLTAVDQAQTVLRGGRPRYVINGEVFTSPALRVHQKGNAT